MKWIAGGVILLLVYRQSKKITELKKELEAVKTSLKFKVEPYINHSA